MKKRLSLFALSINFLLAIAVSLLLAQITSVEINPLILAVAITAVHAGVTYFTPSLYRGRMLMALQTEIWIPGIKENPIPNHSFVVQSVDMSEFVENNKLHLAEAGIEPSVHEDYFASNNNPLPVAEITDIPNEVVLKTFSTSQTRHRQLQEIELAYNRRESLINRHKNSLAKNIGKRAAYAWSVDTANAFNKLFNLSASDSIIDAIIDAEAFFLENDITEGLNICFNAQHLARIKKEDKKLYKDIMNEKQMYSFKVFSYSQNPIYKADGTKKPFGATKDATDKQCSFMWVTDEVFRCFGDTEMYATLRDSGLQADLLSFAQRALVGNIRGNNPKYRATIL